MAPTSKVLVVIDLQNEFLSSDGRYPILEHSKETLLLSLTKRVPEFRQQGHIIWVKSIYDNLGAGVDEGPACVSDSQGHDAYLAGTHKGKSPCCEAGSVNAEFHPAASALIDDSDMILTKKNYSAFKETTLLFALRTRSAVDVYFCGLLSNTCVLATLIDAVQIDGFRVHTVGDCLGWRREKSHRRALERMNDMGVTVLDSQEVYAEAPDAKLIQPKLYYVNGSIPSWRVLMALSEKGIEVAQIRLKVMTHPKPTRLPAFLALNPRGKTPVFVDTDDERTTVNESLAILAYLETYYTQKYLLPPIEQRKYRARILSLVQETENLHNAYDALEDAFFEARHSNTMAVFTSTVRPVLLDALDKELAFWESYAARSSGYIGGGEDFTLADCAFYPILGYMLRRGFRFGEKWPGLERYHVRIWARDSAKQAQPEGWVGKGKTDEIDPLGDTVPPRYAVESDDEDEYNPLSSARVVDQPIDLNIRFVGIAKPGSALVLASGGAGQDWARGAKLGEQQGAVYVNEIQVGLLFAPSWAGAVVLVSETTTRLPLWAMSRYAEAVVARFQPSSVVLLDSYATLGYISPDPLPPHDAPVRYLAIGSVPRSGLKLQPFAPPNLVQSTSASFMTTLILRSLRNTSTTPGVLILLPSPHIPPLAPAGLTATKSLSPNNNGTWSALTMQLVQLSVCEIICGNPNSSWEDEGLTSTHGGVLRKNLSELGEGSMYI
ncbi:hypothetical protein BV22DRAFT_1197200 [Leucogyrophana mollusca]|uniref:Uncharacterized protein n=1 Tax=Leucogyrophana mollusca TaxID=85980 RepID=A0ACB8BBS6_9AGAM|nr:hypothetical protein BV22DRAFT_1197200 [Leucogyrophana mollusca]